MLTPDGVYFFEGNVAAYRTPRRVFLTPELTDEFFAQYRGPGSPVPWRGGKVKPAAAQRPARTAASPVKTRGAASAA